MSLVTRLNAFVEAVGADIKTLLSRSLPAGGTMGQVLTKTGTADYAVGWGAPPAGGNGNLIGYQIFTVNGTYTKATNNPSFVIVEVVGGGAGWGGGYGDGGAGGTSSFGTHCSATGGVSHNAGGSGTGGDLNLSGTYGSSFSITGDVQTFINDPNYQVTGYSNLDLSFNATLPPGVSKIPGRGTGGVQNTHGWSGAGGGYSMKKITGATLAASETVTVGNAGSGSNGGYVAATAGIVIVWEYA